MNFITLCKFSLNKKFMNSIYLAINKVTLLGRVGADPQKRGSEEHPVVVFSMATHQNYVNHDEGITFYFFEILLL